MVKMHLFLRMTARSGLTSAVEAVARRAATAVPACEECDAAGRWPRPPLAAGQCRPLSDRRPPSERPPDEKRKVVVWSNGHWTYTYPSLAWPTVLKLLKQYLMTMMMIGVGSWSGVL